MIERERFEAWARQRWTHPEDFGRRIKAPSKYNNYEVQAAWEAWQEKAAQNVPEGWQLVPTAESRHPGIYKMLGALHAADNTPGMSEWESYRAMLAAAPEAKS